MKPRGQAAVTDLFIAIAVFVLLITIITVDWNKYQIQLASELDYDTMKFKAFHIIDALVRTPGVPEDWEAQPELPSVIGLASEPNVISNAKLTAFINTLTPAQIKEIFKINLYTFFFELKDQNGAILYSHGTPTNNTADFSVVLSRPIIYQENVGVVSFTIWK